MTLRKLLLAALGPPGPRLSQRAGKAQRAGEGRASCGTPQAAHGVVANVFRRLLRQAVQRPQANQPDDGEELDARVGGGSERGTRDAWLRRWPRRRWRWRRRAGHHRRRGHGRVHGRLGNGQGFRARCRRHDLRHHAGQRVGARCARRARALALLLEDTGRHAHRQSRPGDVEQLSVHGDARQLSGVARGQDRQGALAQGHRRLQPAVFFNDRADHRRQPRDRRNGQRSRLARLPAVIRR